MTSFPGALKAILLGTALLLIPSLNAKPSPFDARQDRGGETIIYKGAAQ